MSLEPETSCSRDDRTGRPSCEVVCEDKLIDVKPKFLWVHFPMSPLAGVYVRS